MSRRRQWHPTPVLLPGKSHGWRSLEGWSPWGRWGSDMTERLHFYFSLSCIGEGNGTHSSVLAWRIPGMGEPGGLPSMGSHRVGHDWSDLAAAAVYVCLYINILKQLLSKKCFLQWFKWFLNVYFKRKFTFLISHSLNSRTIIIISLSVLSNQLIFKKDTRKSL